MLDTNEICSTRKRTVNKTKSRRGRTNSAKDKLSTASVQSVVSCLDCGTPYAELGLDFVLPDQQWNVIAPEGGVLCANCICKRAEQVGGTVILGWIDHVDSARQLRGW